MNIYTGYEKSPTKGKGPGIFGGAVLRKLSHIAVEEEGDCQILLFENIFHKIIYNYSF